MPKRKQFAPNFKAKMALEVEAIVSELANRSGVHL